VASGGRQVPRWENILTAADIVSVDNQPPCSIGCKQQVTSSVYKRDINEDLPSCRRCRARGLPADMSNFDDFIRSNRELVFCVIVAHGPEPGNMSR
jgi:hypothetical protein